MHPIVPGSEGPMPFYAGAPPDQQPQDLEGALAMVDSIIDRDGFTDSREAQIFEAWVQQRILKMQAQAEAAAMGAGPSGEQMAGLGSSGASSSQYNPWGGGAGGGYSEMSESPY